MSEQEGITVKKSENFSEWYVQVVLKAGLADYSPTKGCMIIKPYGYAIWENIQKVFDEMIKKTGVQNAYFPLLIPEKLLEREAEHFEGFTPEVAWVTHGGDEKLEEKLAIRPTSETIIYSSISKWIKSWRDLPVRLNQWCNVVRWETKSTRLFLRTREFLWQEGHTAHRTKEEADEEVILRLNQYRELMEKYLAIPTIPGKKSEVEKFAGALYTLSLESIMPDGRVLQMGTSHNLGQHFSKVFDITFLDEDGESKYVWQTSWGISTRLIGALIMVHGDDKGLILPPRVAPIQVVIVPIYYSEEERKEVMKVSKDVLIALQTAGFRVKLDDRDSYTPGWKFNEWELKGVPVRIEIGPKDVKSNSAVVARRDTREKNKVMIKEVVGIVEKTLDEIQTNLYKRAKKMMEEKIVDAENYEDLKKAVNERKIARVNWCGDEKCELKIKQETGATLRVIPFDEEAKGKCVYCGKPAKYVAYFGKAY